MKSIILIAVSLFITHQITWAQSIQDLARTGTVTLMEEHLKKVPSDLNTISQQGMTPFVLASYRGNNAVAKLLMDKAASKNGFR
jgi:ankyrin repeat protein